MKDLIKEVALEVAEKQVEQIPMWLSPTPSDLITAYLLSEDDLVEFATTFLAELSKRAEAVAWMQISVEEGVDTKVPRSNKPGKFNPEWWKFEPLFPFPPIHDIEAIENRVAEACAKVYLETYDLTDIADDVRSGEWRKYK